MDFTKNGTRTAALAVILVLVFSLSSFARQEKAYMPPILKKYNHACFVDHLPDTCFTLGYMVGVEFVKSNIRLFSQTTAKSSTKNSKQKHDLKNLASYLSYQSILVPWCMRDKNVYACMALSTLGMFYKLNERNIYNAVKNMKFKEHLTKQEREKSIASIIKSLRKFSSYFVTMGQKATNVIYHGWQALKE